MHTLKKIIKFGLVNSVNRFKYKVKDDVYISKELNFSLSNYIISKNKAQFIFEKFNDKFSQWFVENKYSNALTSKHIPNVIYILWWQGIKGLRGTAKLCIDSIKNLLGNTYDVVIITKFNYLNLGLKLDESILEKFLNGNISFANFSDYLRFSVLFENGGYWMDSSVFLSNGFELPREGEFVSLSSKDTKEFLKSGELSCSWTAWLLGGSKGSTVFHTAKDFFEYYYSKFNMPAGYFMVDFVLLSEYIHCYKDRMTASIIEYPKGSFYTLQKEFPKYINQFKEGDLSFDLPQKLNLRINKL